MRAGSEGVYGIVGVPPGEILFHLSAQPECCVLLRSGGRRPPHKAGSVSGSAKATAITHPAGRRGVPREQTPGSSSLLALPVGPGFPEQFSSQPKIGSDPSGFGVAFPEHSGNDFGFQLRRFSPRLARPVLADGSKFIASETRALRRVARRRPSGKANHRSFIELLILLLMPGLRPLSRRLPVGTTAGEVGMLKRPRRTLLSAVGGWKSAEMPFPVVPGCNRRGGAAEQMGEIAVARGGPRALRLHLLLGWRPAAARPREELKGGPR